MISVRALVKTLKPAPLVCDCCQREVDYVRGPIWHGMSKICKPCFFQWYDPDNSSFDNVRKKHGLGPLSP